jgi:hypothetical protein
VVCAVPVAGIVGAWLRGRFGRKVCPERYGAEYLSKWRDESTWLSRDLLDAAVDCGVAVRAPVQGINYIAGCDASGG